MKNRFLSMAGLLLLLAVAGKYYAIPLIAHTVRAAVIKNIDERGRVPFSQDVVSSCNSFNCVSSFATAPAGRRLVMNTSEELSVRTQMHPFMT
jgi:hypothetical protein